MHTDASTILLVVFYELVCHNPQALPFSLVAMTTPSCLHEPMLVVWNCDFYTQYLHCIKHSSNCAPELLVWILKCKHVPTDPDNVKTCSVVLKQDQLELDWSTRV